MLEYLDIATRTTARQIFFGFGIIFLIALLLNAIGRRLRNSLSSKLGSFYDYLVLPGCLCHELGRTFGCWLSGTSVDKFEIFNLKTDDCERIPIAVNANKKFAFLKRFLILTSPVWLGSIVVCVMTTLAAGTEILPSYAQCFEGEADVGLVSYLTTLVTQGFAMLVSLFSVWHWTSPFCLLAFYLLFCVASQITISGKAMLLIWQSVFVVFVLLFVLNLIPGVNTALAWVGDKIMPAVFMLHVTLFFVVVLDLIFLILARLIFGKGRNPPRSSQGEHSNAHILVRAR